MAEGDDLLSHYYVGDDLYLVRTRSRDDKASVFIGPKGVGKSAILQMVRLSEGAGGNQERIIEVAPDDLAFNALIQVHDRSPLLKTPGDNRWLFKSLWDYVLCVAILEREHGNRHGIEQALRKWFGGKHEQEQQRLLKAAIDDSGIKRSMTEKMLSLVEEIEIQGSFAGAGGGIKVKAQQSDSGIHQGSDLNTLQLINNVAKELPTHLNHEYFVLIDDLDLHWKGTDLQNAFLGSLFLSLRKLSFSRNIKFVVSLRKRIFRRVDIEERDKFSHMVCELHWTSEQVREMTERRLAHSLSIERHEIWSQLFPADGFKRLLGNTNGMPREVLRLAVDCVKEAKRVRHTRVEPGDMEHAIRTFSENRLDDLSSDHLHTLPGLRMVTQQFIGGKKEFDTEHLREIAFRLASRTLSDSVTMPDWIGAGIDDPADFSRRLVMAGFLLVKDGRHDEPHEIDEDDLQSIDEHNWYAIHPMYTAGLQLEGTR